LSLSLESLRISARILPSCAICMSSFTLLCLQAVGCYVMGLIVATSVTFQKQK
jgi:hypothetical protein